MDKLQDLTNKINEKDEIISNLVEKISIIEEKLRGDYLK